MDPTIVIAGLIVGVLVGLTGMGGGALMTPVLVLVFGVQPLAAVSSDLRLGAAPRVNGTAVVVVWAPDRRVNPVLGLRRSDTTLVADFGTRRVEFSHR